LDFSTPVNLNKVGGAYANYPEVAVNKLLNLKAPVHLHYNINPVTRLKNFNAKILLPCIVDEIQEDRLMMSKAFNKFMHI